MNCDFYELRVSGQYIGTFDLDSSRGMSEVQRRLAVMDCELTVIGAFSLDLKL